LDNEGALVFGRVNSAESSITRRGTGHDKSAGGFHVSGEEFAKSTGGFRFSVEGFGKCAGGFRFSFGEPDRF